LRIHGFKLKVFYGLFLKDFIVSFLVPPEWISRPKSQEAVEGQDVFFPCRVSGVPEPMVTWRKLAGEISKVLF